MNLRSTIFKSLLTCFMAMLPLYVPAQAIEVDSLCVTVEKAGKFKSIVKGYDLQNVKALKVNGQLSAKDLTVIATMPNLSALYFDEAVYIVSKSDVMLNNVVNLYLDRFNQLKTYHNFPYALNIKEGWKGMIDLQLGTAKIEELALNHYSKVEKSSYEFKKVILYPISNDNKLDGASKIKVKTKLLIVSNKEYIPSDSDSDFVCNVIEYNDNGIKKYYVYKFDGNEQVLSNIAYLGTRAFQNASLNGATYDLVLSDDVTNIPIECFNSATMLKSIKGNKVTTIRRNAFRNCSNLEYVDFPALTKIEEGTFYNVSELKNFEGENVTTIGAEAFSGCISLKSVDFPALTYIGSKAFANTTITKIILPSTIKKLSSEAFEESNITEVEFFGEYPPAIEGLSKFPTSLSIIVPKWCRANYRIGVFEPLAKKEAGVEGKKLVINSIEPGTLYKHISVDDMPYIEELVISGQLYDTDMEAINKCENLRILDLGDAFIVYSPETMRAKMEKERASREEVKMLAQLFGIAAESKEADYYYAGKGSKFDVEYANAVAALVKVAVENQGDIVIPNENCLEPSIVAYGSDLKRLEELVYPKWLKAVHVPDITSLHTIVYPPSVESVWGGNNTAIKSLELPSSVKSLGIGAFQNCPFLESVYLGNTGITEIDGCFYNCPMLKEVDLYGAPVTSIEGCNDWGYSGAAFSKCPKLKKFNSSTLLSKIESDCFEGSNNVIGYFYTKEKPSGMPSNFMAVHIPRGTKAGWGSYYTDDIDPSMMSNLMTYDYDDFRVRIPIDAWIVEEDGSSVLIRDDKARTIIICQTMKGSISLSKEIEKMKKDYVQGMNLKFEATQKGKFNNKWECYFFNFKGYWDGVPCNGKMHGFSPKDGIAFFILELLMQGSEEKQQQIYDGLEVK